MQFKHLLFTSTHRLFNKPVCKIYTPSCYCCAQAFLLQKLLIIYNIQTPNILKITYAQHFNEQQISVQKLYQYQIPNDLFCFQKYQQTDHCFYHYLITHSHAFALGTDASLCEGIFQDLHTIFLKSYPLTPFQAYTLYGYQSLILQHNKKIKYPSSFLAYLLHQHEIQQFGFKKTYPNLSPKTYFQHRKEYLIDSDDHQIALKKQLLMRNKVKHALFNSPWDEHKEPCIQRNWKKYRKTQFK